MQVVNTNITGTIYLIQKVARDMRQRRAGRILITGSIAGFVPGTYQAVYNATKAFLRAPRRSERFRYYRHLPDAGCDRNRILRACGHARYQSRPGQKGRPGRMSPARVSSP